MSDPIAAWLPVLLVIVLIVWMVGKSTQAMAWHVADTEAINDRILEANLDLVREMREINQILKDRN